jgi:serine/threonine-protein kinase
LIDALRPHVVGQLANVVRMHAETWSLKLTEVELENAARELMVTGMPGMTVVGTPVQERPRRIAADDLVGLVVGEVSIEQRLGAGGMGVVYAGSYRGQRVAVKALRMVDARSVERLRHEAEAMRQVATTAFVRVLDLIEQDGMNLLVMDLAVGQPLRELMGGAWPVRAALDLMIPIIEAVGHAHAANVMHNDLKPDNILFDAATRTFRILDLGLAIVSSRDVEGGQTMQGVIAGTPLYMAPEQTRGQRLDVRADVYALGAILYELLTGMNPMYIAGRTNELGEIIERKYQPTPPPSQLVQGISRALDRICMTALAIEREQRYPSAAAFAQALRSL